MTLVLALLILALLTALAASLSAARRPARLPPPLSDRGVGMARGAQSGETDYGQPSRRTTTSALLTALAASLSAQRSRSSLEAVNAGIKTAPDGRLRWGKADGPRLPHRSDSGKAPPTLARGGERMPVAPAARQARTAHGGRGDPVTVARTVAVRASLPAWFWRQALCIHRFEAPPWSGGWHANTGNGYYGGLQFLLGTWRSAGGIGRPDHASISEQVYRAWIVYRRDGGSWREWGTARKCGLR